MVLLNQASADGVAPTRYRQRMDKPDREEAELELARRAKLVEMIRSQRPNIDVDIAQVIRDARAERE